MGLSHLEAWPEVPMGCKKSFLESKSLSPELREMNPNKEINVNKKSTAKTGGGNEPK